MDALLWIGKSLMGSKKYGRRDPRGKDVSMEISSTASDPVATVEGNDRGEEEIWIA